MSSDEQIRAACVANGARMTQHAAPLDFLFDPPKNLCGRRPHQVMGRRLHMIAVKYSWEGLYFASLGATVAVITGPGHRGGTLPHDPTSAYQPDPRYHITVQFLKPQIGKYTGLMVLQPIGRIVHVHPELDFGAFNRKIIREFHLRP